MASFIDLLLLPKSRLTAPLLGVDQRPRVKCDSWRELAGGLLLPGSIQGTLIRDQESSLLPGEPGRTG